MRIYDWISNRKWVEGKWFLLLLSLGNEFRCGLDVERIIYRDYFKRI